MNQVGILREANGVRTYFNDQSSDDRYVAYVAYAWRPSSRVARTGTVTGTDEGGGVQTAVANAGRAIISGFLMDYLNGGDHQVEELGVLARATDFRVDYGDDDFAYRVDYGVLASSRSVSPLPLEQLSTSWPSTQEVPAIRSGELSIDGE